MALGRRLAPFLHRSTRHGFRLIAWKKSPRATLADPRWPAAYWALLVLAITWLYWPFLAGNVPAFRDAFHFYYPLEVWLATRADAGELMPHFNPLDGTGSNLIGETSSGLCYPGRVLWWIPKLSVAQRFGVVLAVHTVIAAAGAAYAARRMGLRTSAGCLAATSYSLGGAVLFQHVNPVYLIGAAWIPWLFAECWVLAQQRAPQSDGPGDETTGASSRVLQPRMGIWVAAASLMLLGGDPQATANAGIVTLVAILTRLVTFRSWRFFARQVLWLACAVLIVTGLTALQWLPARHWLKHSQRATPRPAASAEMDTQSHDLPQLLRPLAEASPPSPSENDALRPRVGGRYGFSVAPWHLLSLVWGTAGGHFLPEHTRWLQAFGAEPRMWTASLSIGLLPALWIVAGWSSRSTRSAQRFLIVVIAVSGMAMLGNYAPVWMLRQALQAVGAGEWSRVLPADEAGGMYWFFTKVLPGYSAFRYPAKWSVWFACALALAAADALDRPLQGTRGLKRLCAWIATLSIAMAIVIGSLRWLPVGNKTYWALANWLAASGADAWLGHCDTAAVIWLWLQATMVAASISLIVAIMLRSEQQGPRLRALVLLLTLAELTWAGNMWLVAVDTSLIEQQRLAPQPQRADGDRRQRERAFERLWADTTHADVESWTAPRVPHAQQPYSRVELLGAYQAAFRLGKLHLLRPNEASLSASMSLTPRTLSSVRGAIARADNLRADNVPLDEALAWLGVSQRLTSGRQLAWQAVPNARPVVELVTEAPVAQATCQIEHFASDELTVHVSSAQAAQLVVRLMQDGGWTARLSSRPAAAHQRSKLYVTPTATHLGLFQSLQIPAGEWTIHLNYRAPGWHLGLAISMGTMMVLIAIRLATRGAHNGTAHRKSPSRTLTTLLLRDTDLQLRSIHIEDR